jgi:SAM-dependent methyltransferase
MKSRYLLISPILLLGISLLPLIFLKHYAQKQPIESEPKIPSLPPYAIATPSADGIGKIFMGREISQVMGHPGIGWLERFEREREEAPSKAIEMLKLAPNTIIADIGAGSGYYAFRIAPLIPQGKVLAVDIQPQMLDFLSKEAARKHIQNVQPHLGTIESVQLPASTLDAALLVDSYHEFSHPAEMLRSLHQALKPGGKIYLLEFRAEDALVPIKPLHKMSQAQAIKEFQALGFSFVENRPGLPWQHMLVFQK